jgi:hypothetical protein
MEISKIIETTNCLGEKIKNAYKKDIEKSLDILFQEFDIFKRGTNDLIDKSTLVNIFLKMHNDIKTPVNGGLLFYNGDLFYGA